MQLKCMRDAPLNAEQVVWLQQWCCVSAIHKQAVEPFESDTGQHIRFGPSGLGSVEECVSPRPNFKVMGLDFMGSNGAERNHKTKTRVASISRRNHHDMPALHHLRRFESCGEIAHQHRTPLWMKVDDEGFS
jgi:hypothetical protein